jgi:hypothetical protein
MSGTSRASCPTAENTTYNGQRALLAQLVEHLHGKEGVNGSSPLEGFTKFLLIDSFCLRVRRRFWVSTSTERPPTCGEAFGVASKPWW